MKDTILYYYRALKIYGQKFREIGVRGEGFGDGRGNPVNVVFQGNTQIAFFGLMYYHYICH